MVDSKENYKFDLGVKGLSTLTLWLKNLISNSCYCLPYNSYDGQFLRLKNLVLDQLTIP